MRVGPFARLGAQETLRRTASLLGREAYPVRAITADNGSELHRYMPLARRLHTKVYFATPHHAWARASNENTHGLLRQYLPKQTCLRDLTQHQCDVIAERLNNRPRLRLGFCLRWRPKAYRSGTRAYLKRRDSVTPVALRT